MASRYHNITGEVTTELLAAGDNVAVSSISLANVEGTNAVSIDLFIQKSGSVVDSITQERYYFFKQILLPADTSYKYDLGFNNKAGEFGLFIKLTKSASETPAVDVIIY